MRYLSQDGRKILLGPSGKRLVAIRKEDWEKGLRVKDSRDCPECRKKERWREENAS